MKIIVRAFPCLLLPWMCLVAVISRAQSTAAPVETAIIRSTASAPGVRMTSGLMICDEELYQGRWGNRYWSATGQIKPDIHMEGQSSDRAGLPIDAFQLSIEGQNLAGSWTLVHIEQKHLTSPDGQLVIVELRSNS